MTTTASPDPDTFRPGILAWLVALSGLDASAVVWEHETPQPVIPAPGTNIMVAPVSDVALSGGETQLQYNAGTDTFTRATGGPRRLTLQITADGYDQRSASPFWLLRDIDTAIPGPDSCDALRALGFALIGQGDVLNVGRVEDRRTYPRAVLEVQLGYTAVRSITEIEPIAHARITSHLRDEAGTELPSPPNVTNEVIPPIEP